MVNINLDSFLELVYDNSTSLAGNESFKISGKYAKTSEIDSGALYSIDYQFDHYCGGIADLREYVFINSGDSIDNFFINKFMDLSTRLNKDYMIKSDILPESDSCSLEIKSFDN
ncbi:hypothetical protein HOA59_03650 [archaeon]|jgi:hypothetical protein|nr:hypothetical protein [archaeon]MBT7106732.1 hypothetical protein [archaeon]MBT7297774.1 hypothetical protein [archaeon]